MIRRLRYGAFTHDGTLSDRGRARLRHKPIVESHMWFPCRKGEPWLRRRELAEAVHVASAQHDGDGLPADLAAAEPDEQTQPSREPRGIERLAWRERVEVSEDHVPRADTPRDCCQQRSQLMDPAPFGPCGMHRAQVNTDDVDGARWQPHVNEGVLRPARADPARVTEWLASDHGD